MDLSIIYNKKDSIINTSVIKAIEYCKTRGFTTEMIDYEKNATGNYMCYIDENTYYHEYYFHIQIVALDYKNKKCDSYQFTNMVVLELNPAVFYMGDFSEEIRFFRRNSRRGKIYIEDKIIPGCTLNKLREIKINLPVDNTLIEYHDYFIKNKNITSL